MNKIYRIRRLVVVLIVFVCIVLAVYSDLSKNLNNSPKREAESIAVDDELALDILKKLSIKGRAPKTGYSRKQFGDGWRSIDGCSVREIILNRDLTDVRLDDSCHVLSGTLNDPYTGKIMNFKRGSETSASVQIDHVVALSDAWQKGAQQLSKEERQELANDPLELLAVDGPANQKKADGDAATWLPSNKSFRCEYVARQIAVKHKYRLWLTQAEYDAIYKILQSCPEEKVPSA